MTFAWEEKKRKEKNRILFLDTYRDEKITQNYSYETSMNYNCNVA